MLRIPEWVKSIHTSDVCLTLIYLGTIQLTTDPSHTSKFPIWSMRLAGVWNPETYHSILQRKLQIRSLTYATCHTLFIKSQWAEPPTKPDYCYALIFTLALSPIHIKNKGGRGKNSKQYPSPWVMWCVCHFYCKMWMIIRFWVRVKYVWESTSVYIFCSICSFVFSIFNI